MHGSFNHRSATRPYRRIRLAAGDGLLLREPARMDVDGALAYAEKHDLHAFVASAGGRVVTERYAAGWSAEKAHPLYSGTKSFWGVAAVCAQADGILSLDELVGATIAAWHDDPVKRRVTLRMLLNLTAGIGFGGLGASVPSYQRALDVTLKNAPGSTFTYGGIPLQVFGAVFARKLSERNQTPHDYLRKRILEPIGMRIERWRTLADGTQPLPTGAFVCAREWLTYGTLIAHGGRYERTQIVPSELLAQTVSGSKANPRYGLGWWLGAQGAADAPSDLIYASGSGGQAMYVVPSLDTVIVHFGGSASYKHDAFLKHLFGARPATSRKRPRAKER